MDDLFVRLWERLSDRVHGPLSFRLIIQPLVAILFAIRDGYYDSLAGRSPYFWALFTQPGRRADLIREGWMAVARLFVIALFIDVVYQLIVLRWVYPLEAIIVAFLLAIIPYVLIRGPINRIVGRFL